MNSKPRILVFQHIAIEHPGIFRDFLQTDDVEWDAVELDEGEAIPDLEGYDGLWVMGGPMDVWQEDDHPWLAAEKQAIRAAVGDRQMPFLGLCLGHQLLAEALGGEVGPSDTPEIGVLEVNVTDAGRKSPFFNGIADVSTCLQWHSAEVKHAPAEAEVLASTTACAVQAMSIGNHAFSVQYHVELTANTVPEWGEVPAYRTALEQNLGADALPAFNAKAEANMAAFNRDAKILYDNWMQTVFG